MILLRSSIAVFLGLCSLAASAAGAPVDVPAAPPFPTNSAPSGTQRAPETAVAPFAPASPEATGSPEIVPERMEVRVAIMENLKSGGAKVGHEIEYKVVHDVLSSDRQVLIAAGTRAYGHVTQSRRRNILGQPGTLAFTCEYVLMPNGTHVPLRSDPMRATGRNNSGASVAAALLINVAGVFINGRDVVVPRDTEWTVYVDRNTSLTSGPPDEQVQVADGHGQLVFVLNNGKAVIGTLLTYDGSIYSVSTATGPASLQSSDVKSIYALADSSQRP